MSKSKNKTKNRKVEVISSQKNNLEIEVILSKADNGAIFSEYYKRTEAASKVEWTKLPTHYTAKTIDDWAMSIMQATDTYDPRRGMLMRFNNSMKLDLHLMSCIDNRIYPIQCAPFKLVDKSKTENKDVHALFERPWYIDIIRMMCMHIYDGTKLIEMIELNDKGELNSVAEIPQSNFLPIKGLVIKEEYDTTGVIYKEGIYANYYVQIGNDYTLGMLSELAIIVLAKKLGLGSWMSYIEKYGVPPIFAITDRQDDTRAQELFKMLQAFRSNHFAILKGNEKIETPDTGNADGYQSFSALNTHANSELSKRILGGTGMTDEKSFVGAAQLHETLLKYRIQVDKLIIKFYMNEEIIPRLVKLSSVYAPLANLTFDWDDTETLTLIQKIDAIKGLATSFNFDPEKLALLTGLPITTVKETLSPTPQVQETQKKKPNASVAGANRLFYSPFAHSTYNIFAATWDAATERLATQLYNGEIKPSDLDKDLVLKNYSALSKSAETAWGKGYYTDDITRQFRENLLKFSGAKANDLMTRLDDLRSASKDKESFIADAKKMVALHNETYLNVEQKFAANSVSTAKDFEQFYKDVDIYPCLTLRTMGDANVRDTHAENEGVTKRVEDWVESPPLDPGCRCWLEQTTDEPTKNGLVNLDSKWANNPYTSGCIFTDKHSYFQNIPEDSQTQVHDNTEMCKFLVPSIPSDLYADRLLISPFSQYNELSENTDTAEVLLKTNDNISIKIRAHVGIHGVPNAEYEINKKIADAKRIEGYNGISSGFSKAINKQNCKSVIIDFNKNFDTKKPLDLKKVASKIKNRRLNFENKQIDGCYLVFGEKSVYINRNNFNKKLSDIETKDMVLNLIKGLTP